uniref:Fibronectin type-III domain-containing protein n=1 Tax=Terrapene triunguis TaxID=2587831 RepID=A0A674IG73_9SAUR
MGVTIQNITGSTAMVIWPTMAICADSFYSIMYHPNRNNMLSGYSRKNFQKEERVPASRSSFVIENLTPLTTYILCVTCQSANPSSDQCRIFHTLEEDPASASNKKKDLALGIWLTSSILLLIIAGILLYGCLHIWYRKRRERVEGQNMTSEQDKGELECPVLNDIIYNGLSCFLSTSFRIRLFLKLHSSLLYLTVPFKTSSSYRTPAKFIDIRKKGFLFHPT